MREKPTPRRRTRLSMQRVLGVGVRPRFVVLDPELLDLAGDGVASHAEQVGGVDAPPAGARERLDDQRALELAAERVEDAGVAAREPALGFLLERSQPVGAGGTRVAG